MIFLSEDDAAKLISFEAAIEAVEEAFATLDQGGAEVFPVVSARGNSHEQQWAIKSGRCSPGLIGCKVGTYWPGNRDQGVPAHASTVLLLDPQTGYASAVVQASYLTAMRTAAVDAVAVKHLAKSSASRLAVLGSGHQAWFDLQAIARVRQLEIIRIWDRRPGRAEQLAERARANGFPAQAMGLQAALDGADMVTTVTAATEALFPVEWIAAGTHISAMGADAPGKQELPVELVAKCRIVVDVRSQSISIGECQAAHRAGLVDASSLILLGSVIRGQTAGRRNDEEMTIFDSSGVAIQDLAICGRALMLAKEMTAGNHSSISV